MDILTEVEALADRVSIIRLGEIVQTGTLKDLRAQTHVSISAVLERRPDAAGALAVLDEVRLDEHNRLTAAVAPDQVNAAMAALVPYGMSRLTVSPASLEDLFLREYAEGQALPRLPSPLLQRATGERGHRHAHPDRGVHPAGRPQYRAQSRSERPRSTARLGCRPGRQSHNPSQSSHTPQWKWATGEVRGLVRCLVKLQRR